MELLAPAGNREKLETAYHFGADACYVGGDAFSLRAYADNFDADGLKSAVKYAHSLNRLLYVAVNIFPFDEDFARLEEYVKYLESIKVDAVIVSDPGVVATVRELAPELPVHISTQANVLNGRTAEFWAKAGASRVILARELSVAQIKEIRDRLDPKVELECFVHGAMCISYSGRCLLSSYLSGRDSNRGECVQACRWQYALTEYTRQGEFYPIEEDSRGTYILNSKDLNMLAHLDDLIEAGVVSFKIEGRMKSPYYVGTVVNAYRRALDSYKSGAFNPELDKELYKCKGRGFTTGFYYKERGERVSEVSCDNSQTDGEYDFCAKVLGYDADRGLVIEQRNRFFKGDELEVLSNGKYFNYNIKIDRMEDEDGAEVTDAKLVQQRLYVPSAVQLEPMDILRRRRCK